MINILGSPDAMLTSILASLQSYGIPDNLICDHICYRTPTSSRYIQLKESLKSIGILESEEIIAGRPICVFRLNTPYIYQEWTIPYLELPAPKEGSPYPEGWEHAEFVTLTPLETFISEHSGIPFNTASIEKPHNPEIALRLDSGYQIKFHPWPISETLVRQRQEKLTCIQPHDVASR